MADNGRGVLVSHNKNDVEAAVCSIQCTCAVRLHAYSLKVAYGGFILIVHCKEAQNTKIHVKDVCESSKRGITTKC